MKLLEPAVPSGKGALKEAGDDLLGAGYVVAVVGAAALAVTWLYRQGRAKLAASRQLASSTAQSASSGLQSLLG